MRHAREDLDGWARQNTHVYTAKSKGTPFCRSLAAAEPGIVQPQPVGPPTYPWRLFWPMTSQNSRLAISLSLHAIYLVCKVHPTPAPPWRTLLRPKSSVENSGTTIVHQSQTLHFMYCLGRIVLRCRPQR